jgi:hypothetical protein
VSVSGTGTDERGRIPEVDRSRHGEIPDVVDSSAPGLDEILELACRADYARDRGRERRGDVLVDGRGVTTLDTRFARDRKRHRDSKCLKDREIRQGRRTILIFVMRGSGVRIPLAAPLPSSSCSDSRMCTAVRQEPLRFRLKPCRGSAYPPAVITAPLPLRASSRRSATRWVLSFGRRISPDPPLRTGHLHLDRQEHRRDPGSKAAEVDRRGRQQGLQVRRG